MSPSPAQMKALAIAPKISSFLSIIGSLMIIVQVMRSQHNRRNTQQRLVLGMSLIDISVSTTWLFSNLMVPNWSADMYWALGNQRSCSVQGFIVQLSIGAVMYNSVLAFYYLLVIKYNWSNERIKKIELYMHLFPICVGLGTAVAGVILNLYNPANWDCWIAPPAGPKNCGQRFDNEDTTGCERENNASIYQWAFFFGPLWAAILIVSFIMIAVYRSVHKTECEQRKYQRRGSFNAQVEGTQDKYSKEIFSQSLFYVGAFYITWIFPTITRIVQLITNTSPQWLILVSGFFIAIQGFFNSIVYFRPRFQRCWRENPHLSRFQVLKRLFNVTLCFCCFDPENKYGNDKKDILFRRMSLHRHSRRFSSSRNSASGTKANEGIEKARQQCLDELKACEEAGAVSSSDEKSDLEESPERCLRQNEKSESNILSSPEKESIGNNDLEEANREFGENICVDLEEHGQVYLKQNEDS